jgi:peptidoglycan/xylan/chitin deacetylase (PgdA/CDA1 family)
MPCALLLTYHPIHIHDNSYAGNDLVALDRDLAAIDRLGLEVRSLDQIFTPPGSPRLMNDLPAPVVAITFDDGSEFDYVDRPHPTCGPQRSAATVLADAAKRLACLGGASPLASTFVIASPEAREELDRKDYSGGGYWTDTWWPDAARSQVLGVESHSWDHNHPSLARTAQRDNVRGTFENIETEAEAEAEIAQSVAYIARQSGRAPKFFAYPWGQANAFLTRDYMPRRGPGLGLHAAVSSAPTVSGIVRDDSDRWLLPRVVCGHDWKSEAAFEKMLRRFRDRG